MHSSIFASRDVTVSFECSFYGSYSDSDLSLNPQHVTKTFSTAFPFILMLGMNYYFHDLEEETKVPRGDLPRPKLHSTSRHV